MRPRFLLPLILLAALASTGCVGWPWNWHGAPMYQPSQREVCAQALTQGWCYEECAVQPVSCCPSTGLRPWLLPGFCAFEDCRGETHVRRCER
jgi:hypothetical protein